MDLHKTIQELRRQRELVAVAITALERMQPGSAAEAVPRMPGRRGRTSMGAAEREQVSERMKRYWANRRARKTA